MGRPLFIPTVSALPPSLSWENQVRQYPQRGEPGLGYFAGDVSEHYPGLPPVDCLLWRDDDGWLRGILNHYPVDYPPWEEAGKVNVFVDPARRHMGIATILAREAWSRWDVTLGAQDFTDEGAGLARSLHERHGLT